MIKTFVILLFVFSTISIRAESFIPSIVVDFIDQQEQVESRTFSYEDQNYSIEGVVIIDSKIGEVSIRGSYLARDSSIDPTTSHAFNVLNLNGKPIHQDGLRTPWKKTADGLLAAFSYKYKLVDLGLGSNQYGFVLRFNYVKEGEYWQNERFPDSILPTLAVKNFKRNETFTPVLSWYPTYVPVNTYARSFHLFTSRQRGTGTLSHAASIETFDAESGNRIEQKRHELTAFEPETLQAIRSDMRFTETGLKQRQLGFFWPRVQWYHTGPLENANTLRVIPASLFTALALLIGFGIQILWLKIPSLGGKLRIVAIAVLSIFSTLFLLEIANGLFPVILVLLAISIISILKTDQNTKAYAICSLFLISQELLWTYSLPLYPAKLPALLFSISLGAVAFLPIALVKRKVPSNTLALLLIVLVTAYYATMSIYVSFFEDYPTITILSYASQSSHILDSISQLASDQQLILVSSALWCMFWLLKNGSSSQQVPQAK